MSDNSSYSVRPMRRSETTFVKALMKADGGANSSREDLDTWKALDGEGLIVAVYEGKIVGCCVCLKLSESLGHIGMALAPTGEHTVIIPELVSAAQQRLDDRRITFTCRPDQKVIYEKTPLAHEANFKWVQFFLKCPKDLKVIRATHVYRTLALTEHTMIERVIEYDSPLHSYDNREIMRNTFAEPACVSRCFVGNKEVAGYGCLRHLHTGGWRVSPLVAEDGSGALCLLTDLLMHLTSAQLEEGVTFFIPSDNEEAVDLAKTMGFSIMEGQGRLVLSNQGVPGPTPRWLYAIHTPTFCLY